MENNLRRHGDVNLIPATLPDNAKLIKETNEMTIAFGETTGHNHILTTEPTAKFKVLEVDGTRYFMLDKAAELTHPEHKPLTVLPGIYVQGQEREKDWFSLSVRKVID